MKEKKGCKHLIFRSGKGMDCWRCAEDFKGWWLIHTPTMGQEMRCPPGFWYCPRCGKRRDDTEGDDTFNCR